MTAATPENHDDRNSRQAVDGAAGRSDSDLALPAYCDDLANESVRPDGPVVTPDRNTATAPAAESLIASSIPARRVDGTPTETESKLESLVCTSVTPIGPVHKICENLDAFLADLKRKEGELVMPLHRLALQQPLPDPAAAPEQFAKEVKRIVEELAVVTKTLAGMATMTRRLGQLSEDAAAHCDQTGYGLLDSKFVNVAVSTAAAIAGTWTAWGPTGDIAHAIFGHALYNFPANLVHAVAIMVVVGVALKGVGVGKIAATKLASYLDPQPALEMEAQRDILNSRFAEAGEAIVPIMRALTDSVAALEKHNSALHGRVADALAVQGSSPELLAIQEALAYTEHLQQISVPTCRKLEHDATVMAVTPVSAGLWSRLNDPHEHLTDGLKELSGAIGGLLERIRAPLRPESLKEKNDVQAGETPQPENPGEQSANKSPKSLLAWGIEKVTAIYQTLKAGAYHLLGLPSGTNDSAGKFVEVVVDGSKDPPEMVLELFASLLEAVPIGTRKGEGGGGEVLVNLVKVLSAMEKGKKGEIGEMVGEAAMNIFNATFIKTIPYMKMAMEMAGQDALSPQQIESLAVKRAGSFENYQHHIEKIGAKLGRMITHLPEFAASTLLTLLSPIEYILPRSFQPVTAARHFMTRVELAREERKALSLEAEFEDLKQLRDKGSGACAAAALEAYMSFMYDGQTPEQLSVIVRHVKYYQAVRAAETLRKEQRESAVAEELQSLDPRLDKLRANLNSLTAVHASLDKKPASRTGPAYILQGSPDGSVAILDGEGKLVVEKNEDGSVYKDTEGKVRGLKGMELRDFLASATRVQADGEPIFPRVLKDADEARIIVGAAISGSNTLTASQSSALIRAHRACLAGKESWNFEEAVKILSEGGFSYGQIFGAINRDTGAIESRLPGLLRFGLIGNRPLDTGSLDHLRSLYFSESSRKIN